MNKTVNQLVVGSNPFSGDLNLKGVRPQSSSLFFRVVTKSNRPVVGFMLDECLKVAKVLLALPVIGAMAFWVKKKMESSKD